MLASSGPLNIKKVQPMQKKLAMRIAIIIMLIILLLIPLSLIQSVVSERQRHQQHAENTVATSLAGAQRLTGPVLVVPYIWREPNITTDTKGMQLKTIVEHQKRVYFAPETLNYNGEANVETKYKGIFQVLTFLSKGKTEARFRIPANFGLDSPISQITVGKAYLVIGVSDLRGLVGAPRVTWDGQTYDFANGTQLDVFGEGLHANLGIIDAENARDYIAKIDLSFAGSGALSFVPIGKSTVINLQSSWPHPNFGGQFLPLNKTINENGFTARWEVSHLASRNSRILNDANLLNIPVKENAKQFEQFDITFIQPANTYQQVERAIKYGILFIALTFGGFFVLETLKSFRLHPMHYGLVGLALALFFLLLISLSEHIRFLAAYLISAVACVSLIGYYLSSVLGTRLRGIAFAAKLSLLYAILYGLLLSEDNALVLGAALLFIALSIIMILTRRIDWFSFGTGADSAATTAK
jgi:inner membrane protein